MPDSLISPLRRAATIAPYTDAEQSLRDNANASPFKRSLLRAVDTDIAGAHQQELLEAQVRGDASAERAAAYNLRDSATRMELPTVGPTTWADASESGNYGDYVANTLGSAAGSMAKPLLAGATGGMIGGPLGAAAGAFGGSYSAIRNAELMGYESDKQLASMTPQQKLDLSRRSSALQAIPEAILPTYLGAGGRLPGALARTPAPMRIAGAVGAEAGTEGLQDYISQTQAQTVFPDRQLDWNSVKESAIAGAVAGGGSGVLGRHQVAGNEEPQTLLPGTPVPPPEAAAPPVAEPLAPAPVAPAAPGQFEEILNSAKERFGPQVEEAYGSAKDYVSAFAERANEAVKTAETPADFVNQLFRPSMDEQAKALTTPETEDPAVLNAVDPVAGLEERSTRTAQYANNVAAGLLEDPATPQFVREKIAAMGGDYSSTGAQAYLGAVGMAQAAGKKIPNAVADFVAFSKEMAGKASTIAGDIATGLTGKVSKKNLQDVDDAAIQPLVNTLAQRLGPQNAAQAPKLAKQLIAAANRLSPDAQINEAVDRRLRNFSEAIDDETLDMVTELSGSDALRNSIAKIRAIPSAMSDVRQAGGSSFLESLITNDAARQYLPRIAEAVDELALAGTASPARASALKALAAGVFGSVKNAQTVVDYYGKMRRSAYKLEAEQSKAHDDQVAEVTEKFSDQLESVDAIEDPNYEGDDTAASKAEWGALTEGDGPKTQYGFREGKSKRPFRKFVGEDMSSGKNRREAVRAVVDSRGREDMNYGFVDYSDYLADNNITPEQGVEERKRDIEGLIKGHLARKGEDRSSSINALKGELELLERAVADYGAKGALNKLYEVTSRAERGDEDLSASDDDLRAMKTKVRLNTQGMTKYQKQVATEKHNRTLLTFSDADGKYMTLSAPSMVATLGSKRGKTGKVVESSDQKDSDTLKDAVASVIARGYTLVSDLNEVALAPDGPATFAGRTEERRSLVMDQGGKRIAEARVAAEKQLERLEAAIDRAGDPADTGYSDLLKEKTYRVMREIELDAKADVDNRTHARRAKEKALERWRADEMPSKNALWYSYVDKRTAFDIATDLAQITTATKYSATSLMREARNAGESLERSGSTVEDRSGGIDRGQENRRLERQRADLEAELNDAISADDLLLQTRARARLEQNAKALAKLQKQDAKESAQSGVGRLLEEKAPKTRVPDVSLASKPQPSSLRTDAVLAANPELLTVLDGYGEPKNAKWSETAIRERVFNAYRKLPDTALKTRLESLRKQYREAVASKNRGAQQEAATLKYIGELINNVIASRATRKTKASSADEALAAQYADRLNEDFSNEDSTDRMNEGGPARVILPNTSPYTAKDQAKSDKANKFIGRGAPGSSTAAYAKAWGDRANTGQYNENDKVFVSVNGNRPGALTPPWAEIKKAMLGSATLITDKPADRARPFNSGERLVAEFLDENGYFEEKPGEWVRGYDIDNATGTKRYAPLGKQERVSKQNRMSEDGSFDEPDFSGEEFPKRPKERDWKGRTNDDGSFDEPDFSGEEFPKTRKQSFVGATADPEGAAQASSKLDAGWSADFVWASLGWFRGPDGKMRKEIRSPVINKRIRDFVRMPEARGMAAEPLLIRDLLKGVPGFEAYLDTPLGDVSISNNEMIGDHGFAGQFYPEENYIWFSHKGALASTLIDRAGPEMVAEVAKGAGMFATLDEYVDRLTQKLKISPAEQKQMTEDALVSTILHEIQHAIQKQEGFENGGTPEAAVLVKYGLLDKYNAAEFFLDKADVMDEAMQMLLADIGPDGDTRAAAHALYKDIIGEVEAHDVEKRMKLTDAEAKGLPPALTDAKREFLRSAVNMISASKLRMAGKQTTIGDKRKPPNATEHADLKKKILEEIRRTRGNDVKLRFNRLIKHIGASGEFSMNADKTDRLIEIAVNAADPMGVAWHESLHDFFAMLGEDKSSRSIKRDLVNASNAPQVKKKLRELLKDHPEARKQIEESAEERVAYMYQFWAAGALELGPTGNGIFEKIRAFFRDLFRLVGREERAADLLTALHAGKFADTRVVAEVLADMPRDTVNNRMERMAPALKDSLDKLVQIAPDRLRDFQNDQITELAGQFEDFVQRRFRKDGEWTNKLGGILEGTTAVQRRSALENMQAMKPPSSLLENKLAKFFTDMHGYMTDAGVQTLDSTTKKWVPLRQVKDYFPRVFDRAALEKDPDGFIALLMKHGGMTEASARNTLKALTHGTGQIELAENEHALGFSPYAQAVQDRQLKFIDPTNADAFAKYQSKDLADITAMYVKQAVHRAEYARDFGNQGEKIVAKIVKSGITDKKDLENINKTVMGLEGTLGYEMSSQTKELFSGVMTLQNVVILPLAIFSQMIDPIVLAARSGNLKDAGNAYITAIKKLTRQKDVDGEDLAQMLGIISQDTVLDAMGVAYGTTHMSKRMRNINRVFFKYNGMQGWNNSMRIAATVAGERYLLQNKGNAAALRELGLEPGDIKEKISYLNNVPQGVVRLDVSSQKVKEAMFKFVDQAVLRPSATNRPVWMSDPKFLLLAHLKQFTFAMHNVVLKRANEQLDDGNPKPWLILALAMPAILAADMTKFALTGGPPPGWTFMDFLGHAVERSGLLGLGDFGAQATQGVGQGKMPGEALLGPSFEHLMELLRFMLGAPGVDGGDVLDRTVPGARFI